MDNNKNNDERNPTAGEKIEALAKVTGGYDHMDEDNKAMMKKVKTASTDKDVLDALMTDPQTGRAMSYEEMRMRFG